jgi:hypothetical protein
LRAVARGPVTVTVTVALRSVALRSVALRSVALRALALRALALASASALELELELGLDCWILRGPLCERFCALLFWLAGLR